MVGRLDKDSEPYKFSSRFSVRTKLWSFKELALIAIPSLFLPKVKRGVRKVHESMYGAFSFFLMLYLVDNERKNDLSNARKKYRQTFKRDRPAEESGRPGCFEACTVFRLCGACWIDAALLLCFIQQFWRIRLRYRSATRQYIYIKKRKKERKTYYSNNCCFCTTQSIKN